MRKIRTTSNVRGLDMCRRMKENSDEGEDEYVVDICDGKRGNFIRKNMSVGLHSKGIYFYNEYFEYDFKIHYYDQNRAYIK